MEFGRNGCLFTFTFTRRPKFADERKLTLAGVVYEEEPWSYLASLRAPRYLLTIRPLFRFNLVNSPLVRKYTVEVDLMFHCILAI
jgi:hypothetical protein